MHHPALLGLHAVGVGLILEQQPCSLRYGRHGDVVHHGQRQVAGDIGHVGAGVVDRLGLLEHPHGSVQRGDVVQGAAVRHILHSGPDVRAHQLTLQSAVRAHGHLGAVRLLVHPALGDLHPLVPAAVDALQFAGLGLGVRQVQDGAGRGCDARSLANILHVVEHHHVSIACLGRYCAGQVVRCVIRSQDGHGVAQCVGH